MRAGLRLLLVGLASAAALLTEPQLVQLKSWYLPTCVESDRPTPNCFDVVGVSADLVRPDFEIVSLFGTRGVDFYRQQPDGDLTYLSSFVTQCKEIQSLGFSKYHDALLYYHSNNPTCVCDDPNELCFAGLRVDSPVEVAGTLKITTGTGLPDILSISPPITGQLTTVDSPTNADFPFAEQGCLPYTPEGVADVNGKIALVRRGGCPFQDKFDNAQAAGALAIVIYNNAGPLIAMSLAGTTLPGLMISNSDALLLIAQLDSEKVVNVTIGAGIGSLDDNVNAASSAGLITIDVKQFFGPRRPQPAKAGKPGKDEGAKPGKPGKDILPANQVVVVPHTNFFSFVLREAWFDAEQERLYVLGTNGGPDDQLKIFDLKNSLENATVVGTYEEFLGIQTASFIQKGGASYFIHGNFPTQTMTIWDVTDPANIFVVSQLNLGGQFQRLVLTQDNNTAFYDGGSLSQGQYISSTDLSDVSNPTRTFIRLDLPPAPQAVGAGIAGVDLVQNRLWVTWGADGVSVYDVSDPQYPALLGYRDTTEYYFDYTDGAVSVAASRRNGNLAYVANYDEDENLNLLLFAYTAVNAVAAPPTPVAPVVPEPAPEVPEDSPVAPPTPPAPRPRLEMTLGTYTIQVDSALVALIGGIVVVVVVAVVAHRIGRRGSKKQGLVYASRPNYATI